MKVFITAFFLFGLSGCGLKAPVMDCGSEDLECQIEYYKAKDNYQAAKQRRARIAELFSAFGNGYNNSVNQSSPAPTLQSKPFEMRDFQKENQERKRQRFTDCQRANVRSAQFGGLQQNCSIYSY